MNMNTEKINTSVAGTTVTNKVIVKPRLTKKEEFTLLNLKSILEKHIEYMKTTRQDLSTEELPDGEMVKMIKYITNSSNMRYDKYKYYHHFLQEELNKLELKLIKKKINTFPTDYYQYRLIFLKNNLK